MSGPWGRADAESVQALAHALARTPRFDPEGPTSVAQLAREAVRNGDASLVPHLVNHLLHPGTSAADLGVVADALVELGHPQATAGVATFLRRNHADPEVVDETSAVHRAADFLIAQIEQGRSTAGLARQTLEAIVHDPFTDPSLRGHIAPRLR